MNDIRGIMASDRFVRKVARQQANEARRGEEQ